MQTDMDKPSTEEVGDIKALGEGDLPLGALLEQHGVIASRTADLRDQQTQQQYSYSQTHGSNSNPQLV